MEKGHFDERFFSLDRLRGLDVILAVVAEIVVVLFVRRKIKERK